LKTFLQQHLPTNRWKYWKWKRQSSQFPSVSSRVQGNAKTGVCAGLEELTDKLATSPAQGPKKPGSQSNDTSLRFL
jgi:hypothetical protein